MSAIPGRFIAAELTVQFDPFKQVTNGDRNHDDQRDRRKQYNGRSGPQTMQKPGKNTHRRLPRSIVGEFEKPHRVGSRWPLALRPGHTPTPPRL